MSARIPRNHYLTQRFPQLSALALGMVLAMPQAWAIGFGPLHVKSALGQPFQAEIEVNGVTPQEAQDLAVRLASPDAYKTAGIAYTALTSSIRLNLVPRSNGSYIVRASSTEAARDPFVDLMIDLTWASGKATRAYTALLDPLDAKKPSGVTTSPILVPETAPSSANASGPTYLPPAYTAQNQAASTGKPVSKGTTKKTGRYTVKTGDTLSQVAQQYSASSSVSLDQMLLAMYRANPNAFIDGNINLLKSGAVLNVPSTSQAKSVSKAEAHRQVVAQTSGFGGYRSRLAEQALKSSPSKQSGSQQSSGKVVAKVLDKSSPETAEKDQLKLTKPDIKSGASDKNSATSAEQKIAQERQLKETQDQAAQLEKNKSDLQKLQEIKAGAPTAASTSSVASGATASVAASSVASVVVASEAVTAPVVNTPASTEPSFFDELLSNPMAQWGLGALAVLGGIYAIMRGRRKKDEQSNEFQDSVLSQESTLMRNPVGQSLVGGTGGVNIDTENQHSVFNTNFDNGGGTHAVDANEVDPIAEADVYMAYDRDNEAEQILREALVSKPERQALRLKLLEIYSTRGDKQAFEHVANEIHSIVGSESEDWLKAMALGRKFDPTNQLYHSSESDLAPLPTAIAKHGTSDSAPLEKKPTKPHQVDEQPLEFTLEEQATTLMPPDFKDDDLSSVNLTESGAESKDSAAVNLNDLADSLEHHETNSGFPKTEPMMFDLSSISLNLDDTQEHDAKDKEGAKDLSGLTVSKELDKLDEATIPSLTETIKTNVSSNQSAAKDMKTKLELAMAYVDIGDREGARELLKEVIEHGDVSLQAAAKAQLTKIS